MDVEPAQWSVGLAHLVGDHIYFFQVISQFNPTTKKIYHASVNACLAPLVSVDGKHVITVEGIGNVKNPHPAQERIAKGNGSQCGFCTPGIVMVRFDSFPASLH